MIPTPGDAAPAVTRRQRRVDDTMAALDDIAEADIAEQLERLSRAQEALASVLQGEADDAPVPGDAIQ
ncbi:MAG: hypothetical protein ACK5KO_00680 [Arachnia sp.]